jgi:hypothetical protein
MENQVAYIGDLKEKYFDDKTSYQIIDNII